MRTPAGPQLSPRKVFVPHVAVGRLSLGSTSEKSNGSPRRATALVAAQPWSPPIASPGTRKYLEISYAPEAEKIDALDNGEQHLLRALLAATPFAFRGRREGRAALQVQSEFLVTIAFSWRLFVVGETGAQ